MLSAVHGAGVQRRDATDSRPRDTENQPGQHRPFTERYVHTKMCVSHSANIIIYDNNTANALVSKCLLLLVPTSLHYVLCNFSLYLHKGCLSFIHYILYIVHLNFRIATLCYVTFSCIIRTNLAITKQNVLFNVH